MMKRMKTIASNVVWLSRQKPETTATELYEQLIEMDAVDDVLGPVQQRVAEAAKAMLQDEILSPIASARAFFEQMMEYAAGNDIRVDHIERSYKQLAPEHRWSPLSMKALSTHLVSFGCKRKRRGPENKTYLAFPKSQERTQRK